MYHRPPCLSTHRRLLLVEESAAIVEVVVEVLRPVGFIVETAVTLEAARTSLDGRRFDLVLCDGLSRLQRAAWQTAQEVRAAADGIPVVLFTPHLVDPAAACAAGFAGVIEKPFDLDAFVTRVRALAGG